MDNFQLNLSNQKLNGEMERNDVSLQHSNVYLNGKLENTEKYNLNQNEDQNLELLGKKRIASSLNIKNDNEKKNMNFPRSEGNLIKTKINFLTK